VIQAIFAAGLRAKSKQKRGQPLSFGERIALPAAERLIFGKIVERFGGKLRFAFSGAAALSAEVGEFIDNLGIQVYEGYGMTESSGCTTASYPGSVKIGTVGKPIPGVEVRIDKQAAGAQGDEGEIIIYGTGVMAGYHNQRDATNDAMTADGGLRSGDLGHIDDEGFLVITGRVKELYKLQNGKYVAPAPLEEKLTLSPFIAQAMLHGADKPYNVAIIVPNSQNVQAFAQDQKKLREVIAAELDKFSADWKSYERVKKFMIADEEFTTANDMLTPTLKVKRRNVIKRYGADLDKLYA
jgi:long-chain acyl-CoA synthetase